MYAAIPPCFAFQGRQHWLGFSTPLENAWEKPPGAPGTGRMRLRPLCEGKCWGKPCLKLHGWESIGVCFRDNFGESTRIRVCYQWFMIKFIFRNFYNWYISVLWKGLVSWYFICIIVQFEKLWYNSNISIYLKLNVNFFRKKILFIVNFFVLLKNSDFHWFFWISATCVARKSI